MNDSLSRTQSHIDWVLLGAVVPIIAAGLITMFSFVDPASGGSNAFFWRQLLWVGIGLFFFFGLSFVDFRFLRRTDVVTTLFVGSVVLLLGLFILGSVFQGAQSWFDFGVFSLQPADPIKIVLIVVLAKYFSRRHIEIRRVRHIIISGLYAAVLSGLVFLQPDFGSAIIVALIWLGMVTVSGISKKHLLMLFLVGAIVFAGLWTFGFQDYQKERILTFIHPYTDVQGAGYNALQSAIAVGSGGWFGKGIGYGTQSRLAFLPEYETDFIFAAFAEEWGFVGVVLLFVLFGIVIWRILRTALHGATNFERLFGVGIAVYLMSHFIIHVGMNIGLLPVTGTTMPFMSYGGSHIVTSFIALGILSGQRRYRRLGIAS